MAPGSAKAFDRGTVTLHRMGSGQPLVLLHCLGVDHRLWDIAASGLGAHWTVFTYDFPGHGETPVPEERYDIEQLSSQLATLLRRAGVARAHVAGISLGGLVAQHFAATQPDRVNHLALIDTTPRYTEESRRMWVERAAAARAVGVASFVGALLRIWFTDAFLAQDPPAVRYVRETLSRCSGEGYALGCEALAAADLRPLTPKIKAPTLVVCGEQDIPSFIDSARWLCENISGARHLWLAPARHCSILEQPEAFRRALADFLGERP
jgi:3-oxoadipate enol-lactonase